MPFIHIIHLSKVGEIMALSSETGWSSMFHVLEVACSHYHKILLTLVKRAEDNDDPAITAGGCIMSSVMER